MILSRLSLNKSEHFNEVAATFRFEYLHISGMRASLSWNVNDSIAANKVATKEVSACKCDANLGPSTDVVGSVKHLKGEVPDNTIVSLHAFVGVLTDTRLVSRV